MRTRIAVISDLHIGSHTAPWVEYKNRKGHIIPPSPKQEILVEYFEDFWTHKAADAEYVFMLGDLCQGSNRHDWGQGTMTPDIDTQRKVAYEMLLPHCLNRKKIVGVVGSKYHSSMDTSSDRYVIEQVGGKSLGVYGNVLLWEGGPYVQLTHSHGAPYQYPGTFLDKTSQFIDMAIGRGELHNPCHLWMCGHYHKFDLLNSGSRTLFVNPGWQEWFEWDVMSKFQAKKKNMMGSCVVDIATDERAHNGFRIEVTEYLYPTLGISDALEEL